jgi:hypothetical protein
MRRWNALLALSVVFPGGALAQDTLAIPERPEVLATLTLQEALDQARASSPAYRQVLNDAAPARWAVRNAWGGFLPSASVSSGFGYTGTGESRFGGNLTNATPSILSSSYSLGLQWQLDGQVLSGPGLQKANQRAVEADINNAGVLLGNDITDQYLAALQASAQVEVSRQQVERNNVFLQLAQARFSVGQATLLDVRQAEVIQAQSVVALLQNIQSENAAKIELFRRMGISPPVAVQQVALPDSFPVVAPDYELDQLLEMAGGARARRCLVGAVGQVGLPAVALCPGRVERILSRADRSGRPHPIDPIECAGRRRRLSVPERHSGSSHVAPSGGHGAELQYGRRARRHRDSAGSELPTARGGQQQRVPVRLHHPAVPGEHFDLAPDFHGIRSLAPAVAG